MSRIAFLLRNFNLLNIILIVVIALMFNYVALPLLDVKIKYVPTAIKKAASIKEEEPLQHQIPSIPDYTIIAEENLFHPERKIPTGKEAEEKPLPKPDFVLYGTLITDDMSLAYLEDLKAPYSTPGRGKRQTALRKGDSMSGFTLKDIEAEKIVMVRGEERMTVYLDDKHKPKTRETSAPSPEAAAQTPSAPAQPSALQPGKPTQQQTVQPPRSQKETEILNFMRGGRRR